MRWIFLMGDNCTACGCGKQAHNKQAASQPITATLFTVNCLPFPSVAAARFSNTHRRRHLRGLGCVPVEKANR